jgi:hypothetical protein
MANLFKKGGDNLLNGIGLGVAFGALVATSNISWIQSTVNSIMSAIPVTYISWAGDYAKMAVFGGIGALVGYFLDRM